MLNRLNHIKAAYELNSEGDNISNALVQKGYVSGKEIKEPAVKTLNAIVGQMTVDILINQYTNQRKHQTICVYERNISPVIYEDKESVRNRNLECYVCS